MTTKPITTGPTATGPTATEATTKTVLAKLIPLGPVMLDVAGYKLTDEDRTRLLNPLVGAVILFAKNFNNRSQVSELIEEIKFLRSPSLLIAVDQEGGRVQRFQDGFTRLPAAAEFGEKWEQDRQRAPMEAFKSAQTMATELLEVGVDFSFAPILDVTTMPSDVIGDRCFHPDPSVATELIAAYIDGMHAAGMVAIGKHFPGHGGVGGDSHHCLPVDSRTFSEIDQCDLLPYRALVDELQGVMSAHVLFEQCDADIPTFSPYWLQTILREQIGFQGLVFSDDLSMAGAHGSDGQYGENKSSNIVQIAERALSAGCDMILLCNDSSQADVLLAGLPFSADETLSGRLSALRAAR